MPCRRRACRPGAAAAAVLPRGSFGGQRCISSPLATAMLRRRTLDSWAARGSSANPMADRPCQEFLDEYVAADQQLALGLERRSERVHAWLHSRPAPALHFDGRQCAADLNYEVDFAIAVPPVEEIAYARGIIWPAYFGSPVTMPATASRSR